MRIAVLFLLFCFTTRSVSAQEIDIIPKPQTLVQKSGTFTLTRATPIVAATQGERNIAALFNGYLKSFYGFTLPIVSKGSKGIILNTKTASNEGYNLEANNNGVKINGNSEAGTFYGVQTLIQLLPTRKATTLAIPSVSITDAPVVSYRGMMLDVGRHFFPVEYVKKYIDFLALHKINYFHWHLTEDQGWRIEIKKYPRLTSVGAWRDGTIIGRFPGTGNTYQRYGGFYTQAQVKEIVAYAAKRYITVIPEIEMPGHGSAAIAAYPELSCFPDKPTYDYFVKAGNKADYWAGSKTGKHVMQSWGVYDDIFCAGKEHTFKFLQDVLDEVLPLFPSKFVHIGGDEAPKNNWHTCPLCQKRMKENHLKDEHELQSYFIQRIEKYINAKGKVILGWDEILEGGLAPNAWVMSWRGEKGGIEAAKQHHNVIMSPTTYAYLDYQQAPKEDSVTISNNKGYLSIEKVYSWHLFPDALTSDEARYIKGGQANLWTEYITNPRKVEYMLFPRAAAVCETLWTPQSQKNYDDFSRRLATQKKRYDLWNINYYGKQSK
ncbi:beta-N-acetylhexosaminidase [Niabella soli]|uniref:beta-N-acetylhexosaminidase n=1 Tax=Niabella soli DSM 19437 TaxID=929713 RepID=W0EYT1_9BACT|nr:beta-N-acetylhexosaminidase [Niabella soli]AHF14231.1 beta-N-acetylhexosaminidase [Niabella soli DSM 19437]